MQAGAWRSIAGRQSLDWPSMSNTPPQDGSSAVSALLARQRAWWRDIPSNVRGGIWALIAAGLFSVMAALIKAAGETIHVTEILFFRQVFMLLFALPIIAPGLPLAFKSARPDLQLLRIATAVTAMLLSFTAVIYLPLADVVTIGFARTFFITIFAILILSEVVGARRWSAMLVGFVGVVIVAQPEGTGSMNVYGLMAIAGAACAGLVMVVIRKLTETDPPVSIMAWQVIGIGLLMVAPALWFWKTPDAGELLILVGIGIVSLLMQMSNIFAFRAAEASAIAALDYTRLLWAIAIGFLVFSEWPEPHVFLGATVIIGAALYTMHRENRLARRPPLPPSAD